MRWNISDYYENFWWISVNGSFSKRWQEIVKMELKKVFTSFGKYQVGLSVIGSFGVILKSGSDYKRKQELEQGKTDDQKESKVWLKVEIHSN